MHTFRNDHHASLARSFVGPAPDAKGTLRARGMIGQIHVMSLHPDKSFVTLVWAPFGTGNWLRTASEAMGSATTGIVSWLGTALRNQFPDPFFAAESISDPLLKIYYYYN